MRSYMKDSLQWEDPLDGTGPAARGNKRRPMQKRKLRRCKKGARQSAKAEIRAIT